MQFLDPAFYHKLLAPRVVGAGFAADVFSGGDKENLVFMGPIGGHTGQLWRFTPTGDGGFRLSTLFRGPAFAAGADADGPDAGAVRLTRDRHGRWRGRWSGSPGRESFAVLPDQRHALAGRPCPADHLAPRRGPEPRSLGRRRGLHADA